MAGPPIDGRTRCARPRHPREPDAACADPEDPIGWRVAVDAAEVHRVQRDRARFDQRADVSTETWGQWQQVGAVDDHVVGETAVGEDAEYAVGARLTQMVAAR